VELPAGFAARKFDREKDIVQFDLVLVMDKFTAADVLREVGHTIAHLPNATRRAPPKRTQRN
jgi:hypothetical protein